MPKPAALLFRTAALGAALALAACENGDELAKIDNQIVGNDADPALTSALEDQILVDPALTQQSNKNAVRPPETPTQAQYPLPDEPRKAPAGAARPAAAQNASAATGAAAERGTAECAPAVDRHGGWARRLPAPFALYPGARITDAAGSDSADCRLRIVTFRAAASAERVLGWYRARAEGGGYTAEQQLRRGDHVLAGVNEASGGAYYLIATPRGSGETEVALIVNGG